MSEKTAGNQDFIIITWHISDVQEIRPDLTDEQAREVLFAAKRNHDANEGINWEVLRTHAAFLFDKEDK